MIKGLAITTVWVLDQDRAKEFYTQKLGLEVRTDMTMGRAACAGSRSAPPTSPTSS
ncbi:hypothetical protein MBT84_19265 [Streptomyces sp. MBT84]|nr:hypothetical protein [Streptomyces sp. MBT84]